jgi:hypothetical protein
MSLTRAASLVILACTFPLAASAVEFSGQSRTYLQSRETVGGNNLLPLYEYLDFKAGGASNVSVHFGGWLRYDLQDDTYGKDRNSDLQYAYLSIRGDRANGVVNLGRVSVSEGAASELIDGAYGRTDLIGGFGIAAFGGIPVETDFDDRSGDSVFGGRVSHGVPGLYRLGLSYLKEKNDSTDFREETGLDLWLRPSGKVEFSGRSAYNDITSGWMEHSYGLTLGPFKALTVAADVMYISYEDFFYTATTTAFKFDPLIIDPKETLTTAGGGISYAFRGGSVLTADYKKYNYDLAGSADFYGAKLAYHRDKTGAGASIHRMDGATSALKYDQYRLYGYRKFGKADVTADLLAVLYDEAVSGVDHAYSAVLAGGYSVAPKARIAADVEYAKNPYFDRDVRALAKFIYTFGR